MATAAEVLTMLIPNGGWVVLGEDYENIQFLECQPITKAQFIAGLADYDNWKIQQAEAKETARAAILDRLGLSADEAKLLLS
jgi:hypothetical protein